MALIEDVEIWYLKADPKYPNDKFSKTNPTWEVEIRVYTKQDKDYLVSLDLDPKPVLDEDDVRQYWRVKLKRKEWKHDKKTTPPTITRNEPPKIVLGDGSPVDPNTVGNGSRANLRVFQYTFKDDETGKDQIVSVFMEAQIILYKVYKPKPRDAFKTVETKIIPVEDEEADPSADPGDNPEDYHDDEPPEPDEDDQPAPRRTAREPDEEEAPARQRSEPLGEDDIPESIRRPAPSTPTRTAPTPDAPVRRPPSPSVTSPSPRLAPGTKPRGF